MIKRYIQERDEAIRSTYKKILQERGINVSHISLRRLAEMIIYSGSPKFYISTDQASKLINRRLEGKKIIVKGPKRDMIEDLFKSYLIKEQRYKDHYKSFIVSAAINTHAPRFYVSIAQVIRIISQ